MTLYNMVGCNTSRTHAGGIKLRAGQFRGYQPAVNIRNTTTVNDTIIINKRTDNCCSTPTYCAMPQQNNAIGFLALFSALGDLFSNIFPKKEETPAAEEGKGAPKPETPETPKAEEKPVETDPVKKEDAPKDVYDAVITPKTVEEEGDYHKVRHGECWYDVLDGKYPGIPASDRKAAMRELKKANGMTDFNSQDMPRKMYLPKEIKVGNNVYELNKDGSVTGSVEIFTGGGMYNANIPSSTTTTYDLTGSKNGENVFTQTYTNLSEAEAAEKKWEAQNDA